MLSKDSEGCLTHLKVKDEVVQALLMSAFQDSFLSLSQDADFIHSPSSTQNEMQMDDCDLHEC